MVTKKFLYFIGDAFSRELLSFIEPIEHIELIPVPSDNESMLADIQGILYTPSLNFKEQSILARLPQRIKKIAILDLFHFDFKDYVKSFDIYPPDIVFTPCEIEPSTYEMILIPSFIQAIYSRQNFEHKAPLNKEAICFISQPLLEERDLPFNQHDLIRRLERILGEQSLEIKLFVKPHPREDLSLHRDYKLFQGEPKEVLKNFHFFAGFNSALLYAAEGLGKSVCKFSSPEEITNEAIEHILFQNFNDTKVLKPDPLPILSLRLHSLS